MYATFNLAKEIKLSHLEKSVCESLLRKNKNNNDMIVLCFNLNKKITFFYCYINNYSNEYLSPVCKELQNDKIHPKVSL